MLQDRFLLWMPSVLVLAFFVLPVVLLKIDSRDLEATGQTSLYALIPLWFTTPIVIIVASVVAGVRYRWAGLLALAVILAIFALSAVLVYNSSALAYLPLYVPGGVLGWAAGFIWRTVRRRNRNRRQAAPRTAEDTQ